MIADNAEDDATAHTEDRSEPPLDAERPEVRGAPSHESPRRPGLLAGIAAAIKEVAVVAVMAMALSFVVKTWLIQAFFIPSGSMEDTLLIGDRVIVNKLVPDAMDLHRGDIVVFADPGSWLPPTQGTDRGPLLNALEDGLVFVGLLPDTAEDHLIKRVIGLPGDRVACCVAQGRLTVNGTPVDETYLFPGDEPSSLAFDIVVPQGSVWVMGDHRSNSDDSRYHDTSGDGLSGSVPIDDITGRAVAIVWPFARWTGLGDGTAAFGTVPAP